MTAPTRNILATSALPYANGRIHLGHMVEHTQSDIWVRAMRMAGHTVHYVCADDAHGSGIMLRAQSEGITPQALIARVWDEHTADLRDFGVEYDHYSSTDSDANRELTGRIWNALKAGGHTESRPVKQLYDPLKEMFLPDRFIKGECPNCHSKDQYGDACEVCGKTYNPTDLINPYSVVSGATPIEKESRHLFVKLADFEAMLTKWLAERRAAGGLQGEVVNKLQEWFSDGLRSWDVSRDAPYFGFEIPDEPGKFFYVWVDAPVGYLAAFKELCESGKKPELSPADFARYTAPGANDTEMVHFIGKDIVYFHTLFWPAMLHGAGLRTPSAVNVHGFLTVDGAKMSKSRGTFVNARTYLDHLDPDYLRYYFATLLGPTLADIDLDLKSFEERVNSHLVGKFVNLASRAAGFVTKHFDGQLEVREATDFASTIVAWGSDGVDGSPTGIPALYESRNYASVVREVMRIADFANQKWDQAKPWLLAKDGSADALEKLQSVCTDCLSWFYVCCVYLKPICPSLVSRAEALFDVSIERFTDSQKLPLKVKPFEHLLSRVDPKKIQAMIEASKETLKPADAPIVGAASAAMLAVAKSATPSPPNPPLEGEGFKAGPSMPTIAIEDFAKLDLRVGKVLACEFVEGSDKLLRFELDGGDLGKRQIFSGIRAAYVEPEKLVGRSVVFIANLAPRKMRFGVSEGMILSAGSSGADLFLLDADNGATPGMPVK
ncbi:MAG: methionine--tRNA ligase [Dokdonella sp.]